MTAHTMTRELSDAFQGLRHTLGDASTADIFSAQVGINRCRSTQSLTRMNFGVPTVLMPVIGTKSIDVEHHEYASTPGQMLILPGDVCFSVINAPDRTSANYLGLAVRFDAETITLFQQLYGAQFDSWDLTPRWCVNSRANLVTALSNWIAWMHQYPADQTLVRHKMVELLLLFAQEGFAGNLLLKEHQSWQHRVKELFKLDPSRNWRIAEVCKRLAVSESTLRRHLNADDVGYRDLLEEVRLEHGMGLVMESDMLISQISLACGYQSQSRFAERFKLRFSMGPVELRNTRKLPQESGDVVPLQRPHRQV